MRDATWNTALLLVTASAAASAQDPPRLAWHTRAMDSVRAERGLTYRTAASGPLLYDLYLPARAASPLPLVVIFNGVERSLRDQSLSIAWARALAGSGFAAVTYDSDAGGTRSNFDQLLTALPARAEIDLDRVGLWAASANVMSAWPLANEAGRPTLRAAVMSFGTAPVTAFRTDLAVRIVRVGLDQPGLQKSQDSLISRALAANAPIEIANHPSGEHPFEESLRSRAGARIVAGTIEFYQHALGASFRGALAAEALRAEAGAAAYADDWPRAVRAFTALTAESPDDPELQRRLGDARLSAGDPAGAVAAYLRSRELKHWRRGDIAIGLIVAYADAGQRERAWAEVGNLPSMWNKAEILKLNPKLAAYRNDPEFIARMR